MGVVEPHTLPCTSQQGKHIDTTIHCYETHKPLVEESYNDRTGVVTDINIAFGMYTEHPLVQNTMYMYMQSS